MVGLEEQWLKAADGFRKAGRVYYEAGDLEAAIVEFTNALFSRERIWKRNTRKRQLLGENAGHN